MLQRCFYELDGLFSTLKSKYVTFFDGLYSDWLTWFLQDVDFSSSCSEVNGFWEHVSPGLVSLEFHQSFMSEASLLSILLPCSSLKSLHFHDCRDTFITGKLFSNPLVLNHLRKALPQLAELCFADNCAYLSDALVDRFISLISVSPLCSLVMAGTSISFHPGVHKRFYPESAKTDECQGSKSSELVLTFDCLLGHITHHSASIRQLDFSRTLINDKACLALSQVFFLSIITRWFVTNFVKGDRSQAQQPFLTELWSEQYGYIGVVFFPAHPSRIGCQRVCQVDGFGIKFHLLWSAKFEEVG